MNRRMVTIRTLLLLGNQEQIISVVSGIHSIELPTVLPGPRSRASQLIWSRSLCSFMFH